MRREKARQPIVQRAKRVYSEEGLVPLLIKGYKEVVPNWLKFRYGARRTLSDPAILRGHIDQYLLRQLNVLYHNYFTEQTGENFLDKDWDNLVLLDACRYDAFERTVTLDGELDSIMSLGSKSATFMERNFSGNEYHDTVYVTANSYAATYARDVFHDVITLWDDDWDEELQAVPPEAVTRAAVEAHEKYPDKRLLIHYMQPHAPWIGDKGKQFIEDNGLRGANSKYPDEQTIDTYSAVFHNLIDCTDEELVEIYDENLEVVMECVKDLLSKIDGKTVLSADHGEMLGETSHPIPISCYGHPEVPTDELRRVPWFVVAGGSRRTVVSEPPKEETTADADVAEERLRALGYKE